MRENKKCRECDKLNRDYCYPTAPPKYDCKVTGQCHSLDDACDVREEMRKQGKPRLAEVLGVESGQPFYIKIAEEKYGPYKLDLDSGMIFRNGCLIAPDNLQYAINHPESIVRLPRLTEPEIAIMRVFEAKWATKSEISALNAVHLWSQKPKKFNDGDYSADGAWLGCVNGTLMPSVNKGDCIELEDVK